MDEISIKNKMTLGAAAGHFAIGYTIAAIVLIVIARFQDDSWTSGVVMLALSLPVTILYFFGLWFLGNYPFLAPTVLGMILSGILAAIFPALFGFFPVYFVRLKFAVPLVAFQFGLLLFVTAILDRISQK